MVHAMGMRTGEVAAEAGVNVQTLRYYERRGILAKPKRAPSGYREYAPDAVRLIRFIKRAQQLGFTLEEIEELLLWPRGRGGGGAGVRSAAEAKLVEIDS